ncbi:pectinesterase inhibitor 9-like [Abrus precatorius]|uniref:Pectinesterase inhibitor 9-like n=1 Tax=Abrus precatorius TaxID=3816 RepID=A0A8B8LAC6_ABRPR|nr:pectinesterase inhibitor 9-like [Abrus precatorius]
MALLPNLPILVIFLAMIFTCLAQVEPSRAGHNRQNQTQTMGYIESSCNSTRYPDLCIRCLARFANYNIDNGPKDLVHVALSVSLTRALQTRGYLLKVTKELEEFNIGKVYLTIQDCLTLINDSVDQLSQAIKELRRLDKRTIIDDRFLWQISNVETWVSTALTDASYCVQSFPGQRMSKRTATIKVKAQNVAEVTSIALALFHRYASRYQAAARATKVP